MAKFIKTDYGTERDEVSQYLRLTRGDDSGIFNTFEQQSYSDTETPGKVWGGITHLWMSEPLNTVYDINGLKPTGPNYIMKSWVRNLWSNFNPDDIDIDYLSEFMNNIPSNGTTLDKEFYIAVSTNLQMVPWEIINQSTTTTILNKEMIMLDVQDRKFYKIKFLSWTEDTNGGGGFSYTRELFTKKKTKFKKPNYSSKTDVVSKYLTLNRDAKGLFNLNEMSTYTEFGRGGISHLWISEPMGPAILTLSFDINLGGSNQEALNPADWYLVIRGNSYPSEWSMGLTYNGDRDYSTLVTEDGNGDIIVSVTITNFVFELEKGKISTWGITESVLGQSLLDEIFKNPHMGKLVDQTSPSFAIQLRSITGDQNAPTVIYNGTNGISFINLTATEDLTKLPTYYKNNLWNNFNPNSIDIVKYARDFSRIVTDAGGTVELNMSFSGIDSTLFSALPMSPWEIVNQFNPSWMIGREMIMLDYLEADNTIQEAQNNTTPIINSFYKVKFISWDEKENGLLYTRELIKNSLLKRISTLNNKIPLSTGELQYIPYNATISPGVIDKNLKNVRNNLYYPSIFNALDKVTRQQTSPSDFVGVYPGDHTLPYGGSVGLVEVYNFEGTDLKEGDAQIPVVKSLNVDGNGKNLYLFLNSRPGNIYDFTFNNPNDIYYIDPSIQDQKYTKLISNSNRITITLYQNEFNDIIFNSADFSTDGNGLYLALDVTIVRYGTFRDLNERELPTYKIESMSLAKLPINQVISIGRTSDKYGGFNIGNTIGGFYWNQNDTISIDINSIFGFEFTTISASKPTIQLTVNNTRAYPMYLNTNFIQYNGIGFMPGEIFSVIPSGGDLADQIIFKVSHIRPNPTRGAGKLMNSLTSFTQVQSLAPIGDGFNPGYNYSSGSQFTTFNRALLRYDRFTKKLYSSVTIGDPVTAAVSEVNISASNEILVEDLAQSAKLPVVSDFAGDYDLSTDLKSAYIYLRPERMMDMIQIWPSINDISIIGESNHSGKYFTASVSETTSLKEIIVSNMSIVYYEKYETYSILKLDFEKKLPYDVDIEVYINLYDSIEISTRDQKSLGHVSISRTPNPIPGNYLGTTYDEELEAPYFTDETYNFTLYNSDFLTEIGVNTGDVISSVGFPFHLTETTDSLNVTDEIIDSEEFKLAFNIVSTDQSDLTGDVIRSTFTIDGDNFDQSILNPFFDKKTGAVRTVNGQRYVFFQIKENFTYNGGNIIIVYYMDGAGNSWAGGYTQSRVSANDGSENLISYGSEILSAPGDNWNGSPSSNDRSIMASIVLNHLIDTGNQELNLRTTSGPGSGLYGSIGTSTGYIKISYWDTTSEVIGDGTPYSPGDGGKPKGSIYFTKTVSDDDAYTNRTLTIISCDQYGNASGNILLASELREYDLINISTLTSLNYLDCSGPITSLNVSGLTNLQVLRASETQITSINVSGLTNLQYLYLGGTRITSLNVSGLTNLQYLYCDKSVLNTINLSGCTGLIDLHVNGSEITSLNLTGLSSLQFLYCGETRITSLNFTGLSNLLELYCQNLEITSIDFGPLTNLTTLDISQSYNSNVVLTSLDLSPLVNLTSISYAGSLTSIDFSVVPNLNNINIYSTNNIENLDFSTLNNLQNLYISNNQSLLSINLGDIFNIFNLSINDNPLLTSIDLSKLVNLGYFYTSNSVFTSLNFSGLTNLRSLTVSGNNVLTSLDLTELSRLSGLEISNTPSLVSVDLAGNYNLNYVNIYNCPIDRVYLIDSLYLYQLNLNNTQITSLDLSGLNNLGYIYLQNILTLDSSDIDSIINQIDVNGRRYGVLFIPLGRRTSASNTSYNNLSSRGWAIIEQN